MRGKHLEREKRAPCDSLKSLSPWGVTIAPQANLLIFKCLDCQKMQSVGFIYEVFEAKSSQTLYASDICYSFFRITCDWGNILPGSRRSVWQYVKYKSWRRSFTVSFLKIFRSDILKITSGWVLLHVKSETI